MSLANTPVSLPPDVLRRLMPPSTAAPVVDAQEPVNPAPAVAAPLKPAAPPVAQPAQPAVAAAPARTPPVSQPGTTAAPAPANPRVEMLHRMMQDPAMAERVKLILERRRARRLAEGPAVTTPPAVA